MGPPAGGSTGNVACALCPSQSRCNNDVCRNMPTPCSCVISRWNCAWKFGSCVARIPGTIDNSCEACPSQEQCQASTTQTQGPTTTEATELTVVAFDPPNGGSLQGAQPEINLHFNSRVDWCAAFPDGLPASTRGVVFGCDRFPYAQLFRGSLERKDEGMRIRVRVSDLLDGTTISGVWRCSLELPPDLLCGARGLVFPGVQKSDYSFSMSDGVPPSLVAFQPRNQADSVALDGKAVFTFSERVLLKDPPDQVASLMRIDANKRILGTHAVGIRLRPPDAIVEGTRLTLSLEGSLEAGRLYTLSLPEGAVDDVAGNKFAGLPAAMYTFGTVAAEPRQEASGSEVGQDLPDFAMMGVFVGAFCVFVLGVVAFWKACQIHSSRKQMRRVHPDGFEYSPESPTATARAQARVSYAEIYKQQQPSSGQPKVWAPFGNTPTTGGPVNANSNAGNMRSGQQSRAASAPSRASARQQQQPAAKASSASGPAAAKGRSSASAKGASHASGQPRTSQQVPAKVEQLCPEAKAVEARLRNSMSEPLAARKKILKELLVEYHPDKNDQAHAKEVFQFVNNAKAWFLCDV